jgi:polysaccharide deacetylase family sporulation protein PdaB
VDMAGEPLKGAGYMKIVVLNKKSLAFAATVAVLIIAIIVAVANFIPNAVSAASIKKQIPIYSVNRTDKEISLSFDAAWGNEDTQNLIDILNKYKVKATFFLVGAWVDKYPESVKALSDNGEDVMNHSNTHPHMTQLSRDNMIKEIEACDTKIQKITGKKPILFRAPYGDYNNALMDAITATGHFGIQWDVDSLDWKGISASQITQRVLTKVKPGSIVLFHNAALHTPEALPGIIESLQKQGYKIVPISQLIYRDNYSIDHEGRQQQNQAPASQASSQSLAS